jgi:hypothetical protein
MLNPDYSRDLYEWQDREVESQPKDLHNRDLGFVLEAAGDIFRELTGRQQPDGDYISEKIGRIEKTLARPVDREEIFASLDEHDEELTDDLQVKWFGLKGLSPRLTAVRNLNIALADQNEGGVRFNLQRVKEEWARNPHRREKQYARTYGPTLTRTYPGRIHVMPYRRKRP